jgi:D-cysteine desulfhydrase
MKVPKKLKLANIPTPLEELSFEGNKFLIKRDDLTGMELSGNKVRKLEYLLYDAKRKKADIIFTCGGDQSNHARATAIAAAKTGFKSKLFLWGDDNRFPEGNLFLDKFIGAEISFLNKKNYEDVNQVMFDESEALRERGKKVYVIPEGGSSTLGIWGYINFMYELNEQINLKKSARRSGGIDGILTAAGSGGTAAGLLVGASLLNLKINIYAVNVLYSKKIIEKKILQLAEGCKLDYNLDCRINNSGLIIMDGYSNEGYKDITNDKIDLIKKFAQLSGIILDPAYTGKAFKAYHDNFFKKKMRRKVIFLHSGGLFGVFGRKEKYLHT